MKKKAQIVFTEEGAKIEGQPYRKLILDETVDSVKVDRGTLLLEINDDYIVYAAGIWASFRTEKI